MGNDLDDGGSTVAQPSRPRDPASFRVQRSLQVVIARESGDDEHDFGRERERSSRGAPLCGGGVGRGDVGEVPAYGGELQQTARSPRRMTAPLAEQSVKRLGPPKPRGGSVPTLRSEDAARSPLGRQRSLEETWHGWPRALDELLQKDVVVGQERSMSASSKGAAAGEVGSVRWRGAGCG